MKKYPVTIPFFTDDELSYIKNVLDSGWVAQGPEVSKFESMVAKHEGVRNGIATTSCTTALHLAMVAEGLGPGMDAIAPAFTFVATANTIVESGATPVLADVFQDTYCIDPQYVRKIIRERYFLNKDRKLINKESGNSLWGIVPVHQFGLCCDIRAINDISQEYSLKVIEDSACAMGAKINGVCEGGFGNTSCLSFHPRKSITTGEGGMVLTNDDALAQRMRQLRSHGSSISADARHAGKGFLLPSFDDVGFNYRMTDVQAAMGTSQMNKLSFILETKTNRAVHYNSLINKILPELIVPFVPEGFFHTYQSYVCMLDYKKMGFDSVEAGGEFRNKLLGVLEEKGVSTRQGTHAVHILGYYKNRFGYEPVDLPNAYACDRLSITLPLYMQMSDADQQDIVGIIRKTLDEMM